MRIPDVFIIGAQRCATTWLAEMLRQHPDIWLPTKLAPEPKLFLPGGPRRGYLEARESAGKVVIEKTTRYLTEPGIPAELRAVNPDAKLIVCYRNPVDRAWSHWRYSYKNGWESRAFEQAITLEAWDAVVKGEDWHKSAYLLNGLYGFHIERFLTAGWSPKQILAVSLDDEIVIRPAETADRVVVFLGLERSSGWNTLGPVNFGEPYDELMTSAMMQATVMLEEYFAPDQEVWKTIRESFGAPAAYQ